jgi:hypothetical protein
MRGLAMSMIDRKRIAGVAALEALGFAFDGAQWQPPAATALQDITAIPETTCTDASTGCHDPLAEEDAHRRLIESAEAYERALSEGKVIGGGD